MSFPICFLFRFPLIIFPCREGEGRLVKYLRFPRLWWATPVTWIVGFVLLASQTRLSSCPWHSKLTFPIWQWGSERWWWWCCLPACLPADMSVCRITVLFFSLPLRWFIDHVLDILGLHWPSIILALPTIRTALLAGKAVALDSLSLSLTDVWRAHPSAVQPIWRNLLTKKRNVSFEKEAAVAARSDMAAQNRQHSDATISAWIYLSPFVCRLSLSLLVISPSHFLNVAFEFNAFGLCFWRLLLFGVLYGSLWMGGEQNEWKTNGMCDIELCSVRAANCVLLIAGWHGYRVLEFPFLLSLAMSYPCIWIGMRAWDMYDG